MNSKTRTEVINKNIFQSIFVKGGSIITSFLLVRFCLEYLDEYEYGLWLTISSVLAWFNLFNIGLGHGLRNRLAESMAVNDVTKAKIYISTTYAILGLISLVLILLFAVVSPFVNWNRVFNVTETLSVPVYYTVAIVFASVCIRFFIGLITIVLTALHRIALANFIMLLSNIIVLGVLFLIKNNSDGSMFKLALIYTLTPLVILLAANIFYFKLSYKNISPAFSAIDLSKTEDLISLGLKFFVIQIAAIILFSTDNFIITQLFSPEEVTPYNISFKYFSVVTFGFSIITAPYWSGITDAYSKKDFQWIRNSVNQLFKLWIVFIPLILIMVLFSDFLYSFWLGQNLKIPFILSVTMGVYVLVGTWNTILSSFINGVGILKVQYLVAIFSAIINIPLSIFAVKYLDFGVEGIAGATIFCQLTASLLVFIQYRKIISNTATGIWIN